MRKPQFGLRAVFATATLLILAIGLTQARRRSILQEANALRAEGANFAIDQHWWETVWILKPSQATVMLQFRPDGRVSFAKTIGAAKKDAIAYAKSLEKRLNEFGVEKVDFIVEKYQKGTAYLVMTPSAENLARMNP